MRFIFHMSGSYFVFIVTSLLLVSDIVIAAPPYPIANITFFITATSRDTLRYSGEQSYQSPNENVFSYLLPAKPLPTSKKRLSTIDRRALNSPSIKSAQSPRKKRSSTTPQQTQNSQKRKKKKEKQQVTKKTTQTLHYWDYSISNKGKPKKPTLSDSKPPASKHGFKSVVGARASELVAQTGKLQPEDLIVIPKSKRTTVQSGMSAPSATGKETCHFAPVSAERPRTKVDMPGFKPSNTAACDRVLKSLTEPPASKGSLAAMSEKPDTQHHDRPATLRLGTEHGFYTPYIDTLIGKDSAGRPQKVRFWIDTGSTYVAAWKKEYEQHNSTTAHNTGLIGFGGYGLMGSSSLAGWSGHQVSDNFSYPTVSGNLSGRQKFFVEDHQSMNISLFGFDDSLNSGWHGVRGMADAQNQFGLSMCSSQPGEPETSYGGQLSVGSFDPSRSASNKKPHYMEINYIKQFLSSSFWFSYPVELTDIEIDGDRMHESCWKMNGLGGAIVDTGTSCLYISQSLYGRITAKLKTAIKDLKYNGQLLLDSDFFDQHTSYCITTEQYQQLIKELPTLKLGFRVTSGTDKGVWISLPPQNYLATQACITSNSQITSVWVYYCMEPINPVYATTIIGSVVMNGYNMDFDLKNQRLGFVPGNCGSFSAQFQKQLGVQPYTIKGSRGSCAGPIGGFAMTAEAVLLLTCAWCTSSCIKKRCSRCKKCHKSGRISICSKCRHRIHKRNGINQQDEATRLLNPTSATSQYGTTEAPES